MQCLPRFERAVAAVNAAHRPPIRSLLVSACRGPILPQNLQRRDASISHSRSGPLGGRRWLGGLAHGRVAVEVSARAGGRRVVCVPKKEASEGTNESGVAPYPRGIGGKSAVSVTASLAAPRRWLVGEPDFRRL